MKETKIAVKHTVGNEERIIRLFDPDRMEEAKGYARRAAQEYDTGILAVISAAFVKGTMQRADGSMRLFEVYPCQRCRS